MVCALKISETKHALIKKKKKLAETLFITELLFTFLYEAQALRTPVLVAHGSVDHVTRFQRKYFSPHSE